VAGNDVFHDVRNLPRFFTVPYWTLLTGGFAPYHRPMIPLMVLSVSVFFGKNPFGYHLLNVLLHSLTCAFLFLFLRRLPISRAAAWTAAALFLLHPIHVEAAAWGSARPTLLSGLCFLLCLYGSSFISQNQKTARNFGLLAVFFFFYALGLLTYHSILTLLPVLFFYDAFAREERWITKWNLAKYAGLVFFSLGFVVYTLFIFQRTGEMDLRPYYSPVSANLVYTGNPAELFLAPVNTLTRYSELLLFPLNLTPDAYFKAAEFSLSAIGCFVMMALLSLAGLKGLLLFSLAWMVFPLMTVMNLVPQGGLFADRYLYISSMGFALWAALMLERLKIFLAARSPRGPFIAAGLLVLLLGFYGFKTLSYSETWRNDLRFWLEATIQTPQKARAHDKLGIALEASGYLPEAVKEYEETLRLDPVNFVMTYKRLAEALKKMGRAEEAQRYERQFEEALKAAQKQPLLAVSN
jgi:tetratricopeptide (TPR) repeat protein